jgi:hypothetical protein
MPRTQYTADIRILLCDNCGAPLEAPLSGGAIPCGYCRVPNVVAVRDERPTLGMPAAPAPIDEQERLRRLRAQDGRPMIPPLSLLPLMSGGSLDPSRVQEAFMLYQATRKEVKATSSPDAAERLYFLTILLSNYLGQQGDEARRRALLETALDTLYLPRHKQVIRAQLAMAAAREGDFAAAERWLAPCDARSDDLDSDSAYRCARAYIDTARGDFRAVLAVLGNAEEQIPIADARDPMATVLRANALERLGHLDAAIAALRTRMRLEGATGRGAIESFVQLHPHLGLCPQSLPAARQAHAAHAAKVAAQGAGGGTGPLMTVIGAGLLVLGVGLALAPLVSEIRSAISTSGGLRFEALGGAVGTGIGMAIGPCIGGTIMLLFGGALWRSAREAAYIRLRGIPARGVIRGMERTGTKINDVPVMRVLVTVTRDGQAPYDASLKQLMPAHLQAQLRPGTEVALRVHPNNPAKIILEMQ